MLQTKKVEFAIELHPHSSVAHLYLTTIKRNLNIIPKMNTSLILNQVIISRKSTTVSHCFYILTSTKMIDIVLIVENVVVAAILLTNTSSQLPHCHHLFTPVESAGAPLGCIPQPH